MIRRIRIWTALHILPRDWQAAGPAVLEHPSGEMAVTNGDTERTHHWPDK